MGLGLGSSLIKVVLFIFNLLCLLGGIALIAIGAIILSKKEALKYAENAYSLSIILIFVGSVVFCIAFFGCCGSVRESQCMILTYAFFLFVFIVLQITISTIIFVYKDDLKNSVVNKIYEIFYHQDNNQELIDNIQITLKCCGTEGPEYWTTLPKSCCDTTSVGNCTLANAHQTGCVAKMHKAIVDFYNYAAYTTLTIVGFEFLGIIFTCCLANNIKNEKRRHLY